MNTGALDKTYEAVITEYLGEMWTALRDNEPELYRKMRMMVLTGKANEVRDFIWENLTKDERPLATIVAEGDEAAADDWNRRAKAGEIMRIT